jgi:hypothetical protein
MKTYDVVCALVVQADDPREAAVIAARQALNDPTVTVLVGEHSGEVAMQNLKFVVRISDLEMAEIKGPSHV